MNSPKASNVTPFPNKALIKEEAARWFVRIETGSLTDEETRNLQTWVQQSDTHKDYLLQIARTWDDMAGLTELAKIFPLPANESESPRRDSPFLATLWRRCSVPSPSRVVMTGFAIFIAFGLALILHKTMFENSGPATYQTALGERRVVTLEDGSVVTLNTNSQLTVDFSETRRAIRLVRGEANFQVAKNPERPFGVYAGSGMVWAVGTVFNVRHSPDSVDVTVTEGSVKVFSNIRSAKNAELAINDPQESQLRPSDQAVMTNTDIEEALLIAGEVVRYSEVIESLDIVRAEDIRRKLAWQHGALIFKGESLDQAVAEISRYTDKHIIITDPFLAKLRVGGHYKTDDIEALFASLGQGLQIRVDHQGDRILLSAMN